MYAWMGDTSSRRPCISIIWILLLYIIVVFIYLGWTRRPFFFILSLFFGWNHTQRWCILWGGGWHVYFAPFHPRQSSRITLYLSLLKKKRKKKDTRKCVCVWFRPFFLYFIYLLSCDTTPSREATFGVIIIMKKSINIQQFLFIS